MLSVLGRPRVEIVLETDRQMESPSDIQGLIYISFKDDVRETALTFARKSTGREYRSNGHQGAVPEPAPLFSKPFAEVIARALDEGRLSARKAADLLDLTVDDLPDVFHAHGIEASVGL